MAPFGVPCLCSYGGWQLRPVFPCPTLPQACLSVCLHTKFGSGPCLGAAPAGVALSIYQVRTTFFHCIASAWRKAPIIRRAGAAWAVLADTAHACAKSQERWSLDPQNKKTVPPRVQQTNLMIPVSIISNCTLPGPGRLPVRHIQAGILTQASSAVLAFPGHSPSDL